MNQKPRKRYTRVRVATAHACVNYQQLAEWAVCVVDTRNAMVATNVAESKVWKA